MNPDKKTAPTAAPAKPGKSDVPTTADKTKKAVMVITLADVFDAEGNVLYKPQTREEFDALATLAVSTGDERLTEAAIRVEPSAKQKAQLSKKDKWGMAIRNKIAHDDTGPILVYLGLEKKAAWFMKSQHPSEKGVIRVVRTSDIWQIRYSAEAHASDRKGSGSSAKRRVIKAGIGTIK